QAQHVDLDMRLSKPLAQQRIAHPPAAAPLGRLGDALEAPADAALEAEGPYRASLVRENSHRDRPTATGAAEQVCHRHAYRVEEDFAELGIGGDLFERPRRDA